VSAKICPNCQNEVPSVANLCKHCFHDFHVVVPKKKSPWWTLLFLGVGTSLVAAWAFAYMQSQYKTSNVSIDKETQSIVFTTKTPAGIDSKRVYFKDVSTVEYVKNDSPLPFMVYVVTQRGDRYAYAGGNEPQDMEARSLAGTISKPVVEKDLFGGPKREAQN
jgi:hypothetical protein